MITELSRTATRPHVRGRVLVVDDSDLVLLDVHMPGMGGLEAARVIQRESPETVVVFVFADPRSVAIDARSIGAAALLSKVELSPARLDKLWLEHLPRA